MNFKSSFNAFPPQLFAFGATVMVLLQLVLMIGLSLAVYRDARDERFSGRGVFLISPFFWAVVVFATGGSLGALAYWLIHYSSLRGEKRILPAENAPSGLALHARRHD